MTFKSAEKVLKLSYVADACSRGLLTIKDGRVRYSVATAVSRSWKNPEEWVRAHLIAWLVVERGYPANRIRIEVSVPHRTPKERADVVVYRDDDRKEPYLVGESKAAGQSLREYDQAIEQAIGYANVLRAGFALVDEGRKSDVFDIAGYPAGEREKNWLGARDTLPKQYGDAPEYKLIAGHVADIRPIVVGTVSRSTIWGRQGTITRSAAPGGLERCRFRPRRTDDRPLAFVRLVGADGRRRTRRSSAVLPNPGQRRGIPAQAVDESFEVDLGTARRSRNERERPSQDRSRGPADQSSTATMTAAPLRGPAGRLGLDVGRPWLWETGGKDRGLCVLAVAEPSIQCPQPACHHQLGLPALSTSKVRVLTSPSFRMLGNHLESLTRTWRPVKTESGHHAGPDRVQILIKHPELNRSRPSLGRSVEPLQRNGAHHVALRPGLVLSELPGRQRARIHQVMERSHRNRRCGAQRHDGTEAGHPSRLRRDDHNWSILDHLRRHETRREIAHPQRAGIWLEFQGHIGR